MNENAKLRQAILAVLYKAREASAAIGDGKEWVDLEGCDDFDDISAISCEFALNVLEELGLVISTFVHHKLYYKITGSGVLACEQGQGVC